MRTQNTTIDSRGFAGDTSSIGCQICCETPMNYEDSPSSLWQCDLRCYEPSTPAILLFSTTCEIVEIDLTCKFAQGLGYTSERKRISGNRCEKEGGIMSGYRTQPILSTEDLVTKLNGAVMQQRLNTTLMQEQGRMTSFAHPHARTSSAPAAPIPVVEQLQEAELLAWAQAKLLQQQQQQPQQQQAASPPQYFAPTVNPTGEACPQQSMREHVPETEQPNRKNTLGRVLFNVLFYLLIIAIIGGGIAFVLSDNPGKSYFGYRLYSVKTPSMTPNEDGSSPPGGFRAGDAILVQITEPESVRVGDIITYVPGEDPSVYLTHRVVEVLDQLNGEEGLFFVTKGDANESNDLPVAADRVVGKKVLVIPSAGIVLRSIQENLLLSMVVVISTIGAIVMFRMYFSDPEKKIKQEHRYACA